jgi:pyrroloquinoline quinone biosynthesis protein B
MKRIFILLFPVLFFSCDHVKSKESGGMEKKEENIQDNSPYIVVLGNVQDAGSPQIDCKKACCIELFSKPDHTRKVVSLGLVDPLGQKKYLFEATPDIAEQLSYLNKSTKHPESDIPDGIFISHAHIGHYTGLMYLGKEAKGANNIPVYLMPRMKSFISNSGPWSQLVSDGNILVKDLNTDVAVSLGNVSVECFKVPHRDEFSETVGFKIIGPSKTALFIPDIDKWSKWDKSIIDLIKTVDYAFLDATFYDGNEIKSRDISEIPHPFVIESMALFDSLDSTQKAKIIFTHLNHTNPLLNKTSEQYREVVSKGYNISSFLDRVHL